MSRQFVITDIHGCLKTFRTLLFDICSIDKADTIFLLGDYVNKGPDSKGVIDFILHLERTGFHLKCLRGNHEQLLLDLYKGIVSTGDFESRGGATTLKSFGVQGVAQIPEVYLNWIEQLPYYFELDGYILVHAGLDFSLEDPLADMDSIMNIKDFPVDETWLRGRKILHGHNPRPLNQIEKIVSNPASQDIPLDGGCVYLDREGQGNLVALELAGWRLFHASNTE